MGLGRALQNAIDAVGSRFHRAAGAEHGDIAVKPGVFGNAHHLIVQLAGGKIEDIDMIAFEKAVRAGNDYAVKLWDEMSLRNAQAFGILINTFNPHRLVLGTFAWAAGDLFLDPIRKYLPQFAWEQCIADCEIVPSELRRDIGYYAGPAAALYFLATRDQK